MSLNSLTDDLLGLFNLRDLQFGSRFNAHGTDQIFAVSEVNVEVIVWFSKVNSGN